MSSSLDTLVAPLTPPGQAALAVLGVHGPRAWEAVRPLFRFRSGASLPETPRVGGFWLGRFGEDLADEVVLAIKALEPVPWLELHGHGGRENLRFLLDLLRSRGLRVGTWQEFLQRTSTDPPQAAAAIALTSTTTVRTAAIVLDQYQGALGRALDEILAALAAEEREQARDRLAELARWTWLGRHLTTPWRVVVAGAPNVGKSSLVNALAGYQRSVVAATPGTTRDVVTVTLAVDGWPVELTDTAGLRTTTEALEEQGIRQAEATADAADLCLWVMDASTPPVEPPPAMAAVRRVVNKLDLPPAWNLAEAGDAPHVSAQTGAGLAELCAILATWLVPEAPPTDAAVPFTEDQCAAIGTAERFLAEGNAGAAYEVLARLRHARVHER